MSDKITARLQTPADAAGERTDVHLITTTDEVIVYPESEDPITASDWVEHVDEELEKLETNFGIAMTDELPEEKDIKRGNMVLWFKPV